MPTVNDVTKVALNSSLSELAALEPDLWLQVMGSIRKTVEKKQMSQLAMMSQRAGATISRWVDAAESPIANTQHARHELIKARMTTLAVEQFVAAFTGANLKPSFKDRVALKLGILRHLESGTLLTLAEFEKSWKRIGNHSAGATAIQTAGFWSVPTQELCLAIKEYAHGRDILEIGAGRGLFISGLRDVNVHAFGIDNCSWSLAKQVIKKAKPCMSEESAEAALKVRQPSVVLSVWPPPSNSFEGAIFATKSVQLYLAIVSSHQFASGNWNDYKAQEKDPKGFTCVTNEVINKMLRPVESDQKILIFRRR